MREKRDRTKKKKKKKPTEEKQRFREDKKFNVHTVRKKKLMWRG